MSKEDLTTDGPGSPYSLKKIHNHITEGELVPLKDITFLIENEGYGFENDDPNMITIDAEECSIQTLHYLKTSFNGKDIPAYLFRYLEIAYGDYIKGEDIKFETNKEYVDAVLSGELDKESDRYKSILNRIKYADKNPEARQVIGLIQLMAGCLNAANKQKQNIKLFIKEPETHMHPKRQAAIMSVFQAIRKDYEYKPDKLENNEDKHRPTKEG